MGGSKSDGPQLSAAEQARKRLVSERLMTAAAVHRHTPEGYAGSAVRERVADSGSAMPTSVMAAGGVQEGLAVGAAAEAADADLAEGAAQKSDVKPAARPLPLGLPADILALDLNLDDLPATTTPGDGGQSR